MDYTGLYEDLLAMERRAREHATQMESQGKFGRAAAFNAFSIGCLDFRRDIILQTRNLYW